MVVSFFIFTSVDSVKQQWHTNSSGEPQLPWRRLLVQVYYVGAHPRGARAIA